MLRKGEGKVERKGKGERKGMGEIIDQMQTNIACETLRVNRFQILFIIHLVKNDIEDNENAKEQHIIIFLSFLA